MITITFDVTASSALGNMTVQFRTTGADGTVSSWTTGHSISPSTGWTTSANVSMGGGLANVTKVEFQVVIAASSSYTASIGIYGLGV
jgi:hypothetical protein